MNNNFNEMYPEFTHEIGNDENDIHRFNESLRWVECVQNEIAARSNQSVFAWYGTMKFIESGLCVGVAVLMVN